MPRMPCRRIFLDWNSAPLHAARDWLLTISNRLGPSIDLSHAALCLPSARSIRLLSNILIDAAESSGGLLIPPHTFTPGSLVATLAGLARSTTTPPASPLAQKLAWQAALATLSKPDLAALRGGLEFDESQPLALASVVARSHARLTSNLKTFADALAHGAPLQGAAFEPRLTALANAEAAYAQALHNANVSDLAFDAARHPASSTPSTPDWAHLILIGVADIPPPLAAHLATLPAHIDAVSLIFAPDSLTHRFDSLGGVIPSEWEDASIDLANSTLSVVDSADDLADAALAHIAALPNSTTVDDVVLAVPEAALMPRLVRHAQHCDLRIRSALGPDLARTPTASLLRAVEALLRKGQFREWGTLLRHPWFERAVLAQPSHSTTDDARDIAHGDDQSPDPTLNHSPSEHWLDALDRYVLEHVPHRVTGRFVADPNAELLARVHAATRAVLGDLANELWGDDAPTPSHNQPAPRRPLSHWAEAIGQFLDALTPTPDENDRAARAESDAFEAARAMLASLAHTPSLDRPTTAALALSLVLDLASEGSLPPEDQDDAVEAVGWLELPLDPAPHAVIAGLAEGAVPSKEPSDPFLPQAILRAVGIDRPAIRVARDAYFLSLIAHSHETLSIILSRNGADGEPALPSRLLFRADDETSHRRARLWSPRKDAPKPVIPRPPVRTTAPTSRFESMRVPEIAVPKTWRVTAFRDYLRSPYVFYLRHVLGVDELDDIAPELQPQRFGTLVHDVLRDFSNSPDATHTDATRIRESLRARFATLLLRRFGPDTTVPIWVQSEQALARLDGFANWQAERTSLGWKTTHVEWSPGKEGVPFTWHGGEIRLTGRIDRIDHHPTLGLALLDYKLFDTPKAPDKTHRKGGGWIDLQLPLYRHLAKSILDSSTTSTRTTLAYITLPADGVTRFEQAPWSQAELDSADETARGIIARVHEGIFREQGSEPPTGGVFGALVGFGHLGEISSEDEEAES